MCWTGHFKMVKLVLNFNSIKKKKDLLKGSSSNIFSPHLPIHAWTHQPNGQFPTHLSPSVIKKGWGGCHAQTGLTACLLGLIRTILAFCTPVANPLVGDAIPILAFELISFTFVFNWERRKEEEGSFSARVRNWPSYFCLFPANERMRPKYNPFVNWLPGNETYTTNKILLTKSIAKDVKRKQNQKRDLSKMCRLWQNGCWIQNINPWESGNKLLELLWTLIKKVV